MRCGIWQSIPNGWRPCGRWPDDAALTGRAARDHRSGMTPFHTLTGTAAPLDVANVDTDQIIPKQFLKTVEREGLGKGLFYDLRFDGEGREKPEFVLNRPEYKGAGVLVAGDNFGCGSSREHAPWALM